MGIGLATGDRPPPVRQAAGEVGADGQGPGEDRPDHRRGDRYRRYPALRPHLRRLSDGRRLHGGRGEDPGSRAGAVQSRRGSRGGREAAGRSAPAGDHGWLGSLLGPGGVRAAGTGRGARHPRLPQRSRPRMPTAGPRALLLPRPWLRSQGMRRRPGDRRAARLPARFWKLDWRGGETDPARLRAGAAREDPAARSRPRRGHRRHADARFASRRPPIPGGPRPGSAGSGRSRRRIGRRRTSSSRTIAPRSTRCGSTGSWAGSSTETRS